MMAVFHLAASVSGSCYCALQLTVSLSWLTGTLEQNRAIIDIISNTYTFPCYDKSKCLLCVLKGFTDEDQVTYHREYYSACEDCSKSKKNSHKMTFVTTLITNTALEQSLSQQYVVGSLHMFRSCSSL